MWEKKMQSRDTFGYIFRMLQPIWPAFSFISLDHFISCFVRLLHDRIEDHKQKQKQRNRELKLKVYGLCFLFFFLFFLLPLLQCLHSQLSGSFIISAHFLQKVNIYTYTSSAVLMLWLYCYEYIVHYISLWLCLYL